MIKTTVFSTDDIIPRFRELPLEDIGINSLRSGNIRAYHEARIAVVLGDNSFRVIKNRYGSRGQVLPLEELGAFLSEHNHVFVSERRILNPAYFLTPQ